MTRQWISSEIDYPRDRKFGRASDRIAPVNCLHVAGFLALLVGGVILAGCGAVLAVVFVLPLDI